MFIFLYLFKIGPTNEEHKSKTNISSLGTIPIFCFILNLKFFILLCMYRVVQSACYTCITLACIVSEEAGREH